MSQIQNECGKLEYVVVETEDERTEVTLFPVNARDEELLTMWITVDGESAIPLPEIE